MGSCGTFISNSSEYLTKEAVSKFNIKIVPDNTVLLSFKLTVGRIALTNGEMTTNEAIAHFITDKKQINEYLYCYLKNFNFQTMGSTSSIATAVNSKIIKAMPFVLPTEKELTDFHNVTAPMFNEIKKNQQENTRLSLLRDTLLPKLMKGEIDVSKVDVSALTSADKLSFSILVNFVLRNIFILQVFIFNELIFQINMTRAIPLAKKKIALKIIVKQPDFLSSLRFSSNSAEV